MGNNNQFFENRKSGASLLVILVLAFCFLTFSYLPQGKADTTIGVGSVAQTGQEVMDALLSLNCTTQGIGDLLRTEFAHTCIVKPFANFAIASIISPGKYPIMVLRMKMNDDDMFPNACSRENRIDYYDQKISFAICNDTLLATQRVIGAADAIVPIAESIVTGKSPWEEIKDAWNVPAHTYHTSYDDKKEGDQGIFIDVTAPFGLPWKVIRENDQLCVATKSIFGWLTVGCKYIKEPFPQSIYGDFWGQDSLPTNNNNPSAAMFTECTGATSCYARANRYSRTSAVMTGPLIECVKEMTAKLMISRQVCNFGDVQNALRTDRASSAFFTFQYGMHKTVTALLILYVMLFGFKVITTGEAPPKAEFVNFVIKFILVVYFSVGININNGDGERLDGIIEWLFPFLLNGLEQLSSWITNASPSELCRFYASDYEEGHGHLAVWDSLDCRLSHYLGLDMLQNLIVDNMVREHSLDSLKKMDLLSFPIPPYLYLLLPAIYIGNFDLVMLALLYPLLLISVGAFVLNAAVVCMISIVVLGVLAPLFVPMALFEYTKGFFESWLKLLISFMLQPMVAVVFMTTLMSVYDFGFYGTCKYFSVNYTFDGGDLTIIDDLQRAIDKKAVKHFTLNNRWESDYTQEEEENCRGSLGFILNNPLSLFGTAGEKVVAKASNDVPHDFVSGVKFVPGLFFTSIEVIIDMLKQIMKALFIACCTVYLMYYFSATLAEFAADMTEGVSIGNMAIKPQKLFQLGLKAMSMAAGAAGAAGGGGAEGASGGAASAESGDSASLGSSEGTSRAGVGDSSGGGGDGHSEGNASTRSDASSTNAGGSAPTESSSAASTTTGPTSGSSPTPSQDGKDITQQDIGGSSSNTNANNNTTGSRASGPDQQSDKSSQASNASDQGADGTTMTPAQKAAQAAKELRQKAEDFRKKLKSKMKKAVKLKDTENEKDKEKSDLTQSRVEPETIEDPGQNTAQDAHDSDDDPDDGSNKNSGSAEFT